MSAESYMYWYNKYRYGRTNLTENSYCKICEHYVDFYLFFKGELYTHRIDGPATFYESGGKAWYFYNHQINNEPVAEYTIIDGWEGPFYDWTVEQGMDIDNLTDEDKTLIKMVWS